MKLLLNKDECIGCGQCETTCPSGKIHVDGGKANWQGNCMLCGQCYSVCPQNAIEYDVIGAADAGLLPNYLELNPQKLSEAITPDQLRAALWTRRSVRRFTDAPVSEQQLAYLLDAGHSAPTASNARDVRYILLRDKLPEIRALAFKVLADKGRKALAADSEPAGLVKYYAEKWIAMEQVYRETGKDMLFFNAPLVMMFAAKNPVNAPLAAAQVNLMAEALGLGACYVGFATIAAADPAFAEAIGLRDREQLICTLAIGHPDITYQRIPARPAQDVTIL